MVSRSTILLIAGVAHAANRALALAAKEFPSPPAWPDAGPEAQAHMVRGVEFAIANPAATAEDQHNAWLADMKAKGWTLGDVKDAIAKTHPAMVPYDELPLLQRAKGDVFRAIVLAMHAQAEASSGIDTSAPEGMVRILCVNPNLNPAKPVNGVRFTEDRGQFISEPVAVAVAERFARVPGYSILGQKSAAEIEADARAMSGGEMPGEDAASIAARWMASQAAAGAAEAGNKAEPAAPPAGTASEPAPKPEQPATAAPVKPGAKGKPAAKGKPGGDLALAAAVVASVAATMDTAGSSDTPAD